jgi:hypothetical protein
LLQETLKAKLMAGGEGSSIQPANLKSILIAELDRQWVDYLKYESDLKEEGAINLGGFAAWFSRYSKGMESRFDVFFKEAGEKILRRLLEDANAMADAPAELRYAGEGVAENG